MNTLIIDTSHTALVVGLVTETQTYKYQDEVHKKHSELLIKTVDTALKEANLAPMDIDRIVIAVGPGSYTGTRIGLTFVKTFALVNTACEIYTVDTLLGFIGMNDGFSMIDARSRRVFGAFASKGIIRDERVYTLEEVETMETSLFGDTHLLEKDREDVDIIQNYCDASESWKRVENIDTLVPNYLK